MGIRPGMCTPAWRSMGNPACSIKATGGFTHFIEGLEPAGPSVARWANLCPTGRAAQKALKVLRMSARERLR